MKKISYLIYKILKFFDNLLVMLTNRNFLLFFSDFFNNDFYISKKINSKKTKFFIPNETSKWRVETLFTKEPETLEWIDTFSNVNTDDEIIFWDIGANIGLYSIYAAQKYKNIKVFSFEPSTSNLRILSRNISINNLQNKIIISQFPLIDQKFTFMELNEPEFIEGWSMNSYGKALDYQGKNFIPKQRYKMFGTSIDYLLDQKIIQIPNHIKIDVDGVEDKIISGGKNFLKHKDIKSISIELSEDYLEQYENVVNLLKQLNFSFKHKKHAMIYDQSTKFSKVFNYIFIKNE